MLLVALELSVLHCALPHPQPSFLRWWRRQLELGAAGGGGGEGAPDQGHAGEAALGALPGPWSWFQDAAGTAGTAATAAAAAGAGGAQGDRAPPPPPRVPFAAVWCSREALLAGRLPWLLHCAVELRCGGGGGGQAGPPPPQQQQQQGQEDEEQQEGHHHQQQGRQQQQRWQQHQQRTSSGSPLVAALRTHLGDVVVDAFVPGGAHLGHGSHHAEAELCAAAAAAAGLCRLEPNPMVGMPPCLPACPPACPPARPPALPAALPAWPAFPGRPPQLAPDTPLRARDTPLRARDTPSRARDTPLRARGSAWLPACVLGGCVPGCLCAYPMA